MNKLESTYHYCSSLTNITTAAGAEPTKTNSATTTTATAVTNTVKLTTTTRNPEESIESSNKIAIKLSSSSINKRHSNSKNITNYNNNSHKSATCEMGITDLDICAQAITNTKKLNQINLKSSTATATATTIAATSATTNSTTATITLDKASNTITPAIATATTATKAKIKAPTLTSTPATYQANAANMVIPPTALLLPGKATLRKSHSTPSSFKIRDVAAPSTADHINNNNNSHCNNINNNDNCAINSNNIKKNINNNNNKNINDDNYNNEKDNEGKYAMAAAAEARNQQLLIQHQQQQQQQLPQEQHHYSSHHQSSIGTLSDTLDADNKLQPSLPLSPDPQLSGSNNNQSDDSSSQGAIVKLDVEQRFGCAHYKRRAMFVTPCCNKFYKCRFCHDENETHHFDRKTLTELICSECNTRQKVQEQCENCGVRFGRYTCLICNLFDDTDKKQYHCHGCGICRIGGAENFFHCEVCDMCLPIRLKIYGHRCVENVSRSHCPVCLGDIHTSRIPCHIPDCGHLLHKTCFDQLLASGHYTCPTCQTSLIDMTALWEYLDAQAVHMPVPKKYENQRIHIFCNDCHKTSKTKFNFMGLKCTQCGAYNTTQNVKRRMSFVSDEPSSA